jgi:hypothetical protein
MSTTDSSPAAIILQLLAAVTSQRCRVLFSPHRHRDFRLPAEQWQRHRRQRGHQDGITDSRPRTSSRQPVNAAASQRAVHASTAIRTGGGAVGSSTGSSTGLELPFSLRFFPLHAEHHRDSKLEDSALSQSRTWKCTRNRAMAVQLRTGPPAIAMGWTIEKYAWRRGGRGGREPAVDTLVTTRYRSS